MDVLVYAAILLVYIWVVQPLAGGHAAAYGVTLAILLGIAVRSVWKQRLTRKQQGLSLDNLAPALAAYLSATLAYAGVVVLLLGDWNELPAGSWPPWNRVSQLLLWAFAQQFCLLSFIFTRLRGLLAREGVAVLVAAAIFAFFHLPNPFLTLYTLGGGVIMASLFRRWPNLVAATLAHSLATVLVVWLLGMEAIGGMRVGPGYLSLIWR
jgi:membrane protease YdiL (CAAX protease family)